MKTKEMKRRGTRGITLIALVVTIVVLLILAGTAIAMLTGDSGIMTNAQNVNRRQWNNDKCAKSKNVNRISRI